MKHFVFIIMMMLVVTSAYAADVGVSVSVGQPGFYGRIDIGNYPQPEVIYAKPVVIHAAPAGVVYQPMYVHILPVMRNTGASTAPSIMPVAAPSISCAIDGTMTFMCPSIRRVMGRGTAKNTMGNTKEKRTKTIMGMARAMINTAAAQFQTQSRQLGHKGNKGRDN